MDIFQVLIVQPIFNILIAIYSIIPGRDFGVALIIFTVLARWAMWPLLKKQLHQTKAMQKMQPELARIKREAKGNKQLEGMMMLELYKKYDINPFRSIGILAIQIPIFIALYQVIQIFTVHRNLIAQYTYGFLKFFPAVQDLISHPEHFNQITLGFIDLSAKALTTNPFTINIVLMIIAVLAGITQYVMTKQIMPKQQKKRRLRDILNEASEGKQADQSELNQVMMGSMTKFLPVMMFLIIVNLPGAIALYYTVSNVVAMLQQRHILKEDTEEMIEIADEPKPHKKATAKARAKEAREAETVTRIKAKESGTWRSK